MSTNLTTLNHSISAAQAKVLIQAFKALYEPAQDNDMIIAKSALSRAQSFNKASVIALLSQDGVIGVRAYMGLYSTDAEASMAGKLVIILCAIDANGNDFHLSADYDGPEPLILEDAQLCPPYCPAPSTINCL